MHAKKQHAREPGDLQRAFGNMRRPVREGHKPHDGHARVGEVGLRRITCEPAEQSGASCGGGWGGKGAAGGEHRADAHAPDLSRNYACPSAWTVCVEQTAVPEFAFAPFILQKSRMRRRARTDLCGGRSVRIVPTATITKMIQ